MSKAVYYKSYSAVPTDLPEEVYFYKIRTMFEFINEHFDKIDVYLLESNETRTMVLNFLNNADYDALLSSPGHPANVLPVFVNDSTIINFSQRRNITLTVEIIDDWVVDETLPKATFEKIQLVIPPMTEEEIQNYNAQLVEIETHLEQINYQGRYWQLLENE